MIRTVKLWSAYTNGVKHNPVQKTILVVSNEEEYKNQIILFGELWITHLDFYFLITL